MPTSRELFDTLKEKSLNANMNTEEGYYDSIVDQVKTALNSDDEAQRDETMKFIYQTLTNQAAKSALIHRGLMSLSDDMYEEYDGKIFSSALSTSAHVEQLLKEIVKESGIDYVCKENMGFSNEEYIDYIGALATSVKMKDVQDEFFKQSTIESRQNAMDKYAQELLDDQKQITYSGNFNDNNDRQISGVYALYENAWDNIKKAGFFGNLFNLGNFFKNVGLIRKANAIFNKVGFNVDTDGPDAKSAFEATPDECAGRDLAYLSEMERSFKEDEKIAQFNHVTEITAARDKLNNTIAAIGNGTMEHPMHKINAILGKYGASVTENKEYRPGMVEGIAAMGEDILALDYDKTRRPEPFREYIQGVFFRGLFNMMDAALQDGKTLNISEVIKDASDIAVMMAKDYTLLYEAPELKAIAENSAFGSYDSEKVFGYVKRNLDNKNATDKYDLDALKNEIEQTMKEYKNPIIEESKTQKVEETVNETVNETVIDEEKKELPLRENIEVDLNNAQANHEQKQEKISDKTLAKTELFK